MALGLPSRDLGLGFGLVEAPVRHGRVHGDGAAGSRRVVQHSTSGEDGIGQKPAALASPRYYRTGGERERAV
jgi:hypothetical protein